MSLLDHGAVVSVTRKSYYHRRKPVAWFAIFALLVTLLPFAGGGEVRAATTNVTVSPINMDSWATRNATCGAPSTGSIGFVNGPATPPRGAGSLQYTIGTNGDSFVEARSTAYNLVLLSQITSLSYSTYVSRYGSGGQAPYLILNIDYDNNPATIDDLLFFEPVYQNGTYATQPGNTVPNQGNLTLNTWQTWDAKIGGWWSLNAGGGPPLYTLAGYAAAHPGARIVNASSGGGFRISTGCGAGAWDNFVGNADNVTIGVNGNDTVYDFDPAVDLAIAKQASPNPVTAGSNVTYTLTVVNNGPANPVTTTVTDNLPANTTFVSCAASNGGVCGGSGNNRTVTFSSLAAGASATILLVARVDPATPNGTVISNTASISSSSPEVDTSNNSSTATVTVSNPATPPPPVPPPTLGWTDWTSLGGILTDAPAAAGFNGQVYVFAKGTDNALYVTSSADGVKWRSWDYLGGVLTDAPAATSFNGRLYVFAKGTDNALYVKSSGDGSSFTDWTRLGGVLTAPPAATSFNGQLFVFVRGTNVGTASSPIYPLWVMSSADGMNWTGWQSQGGNLTAAPAATTFGGQLYVFARGIQAGTVPNPMFPGQPNPPIYPLYEKHSSDGVTFTDWRNLEGNLVAAPAAASYTPPGGTETLYTFANGTDNTLYERHSTDGVTWTGWVSLGGQLVGPPAAAGVPGQQRLYAVVRWRDNALWLIRTTP